MIDETLLLEIVDNQGWSFPLQSPLILDSKKVLPEKIQLYLRLIQYINQDGKCLCGQDLNGTCELHHALISRKDALNLTNPEEIHSQYNVLLLHPNCHHKAKRSLCLAYLLEMFSFADIQKWYQSVKSKSQLRKLEGIL